MLIKHFWPIFRLIFVCFSLYLLGDAFYRWDGFSYYASFSEFIPSLALAIILWSIIAVIAALLVWVILSFTEWICKQAGLRISFEQVLLYMAVFILLGSVIWLGKISIWSGVVTGIKLKSAVLVLTALVSLSLTWFFRGRAEQWTGVVQGRITPLVWLFGLCFIVSIPLVAYHTWIKDANKASSQERVSNTATDNTRPNILLVTFDALAARNMSLYGYHRDTTPFISKWAEDASVFTRFEAAGNWTSTTTASLMTGKRAWTHRRYQSHASRPFKSDTESLPLLLKNSGYYNMAFITNSNASVWDLGISNSFAVAPLTSDFIRATGLYGFLDKQLYSVFGVNIKLYNWILKDDFALSRFVPNYYFANAHLTEFPIETAIGKFINVLDSDPPKPYFAWVHLYPPHDPYLPPYPYMGMFNASMEFRDAVSQKPFYKIAYGDYPTEMQASVNIFGDRYDEFIRYCDEQFENLIEHLSKENKLDNTIIILSADHGESFEHNYLSHGGKHLYEQVTNIPLVIKEPRQAQGLIINELVEQIDLPATILDRAGISLPTWMEGRSFLPLLRGEKLPVRYLFAMTFDENISRGHQITKGTIAAWQGDYKLIHYLEKNKSLLFNLNEDPEELNNLIDKEPAIGQRYLEVIRENLKLANERLSREKSE